MKKFNPALTLLDETALDIDGKSINRKEDQLEGA